MTHIAATPDFGTDFGSTTLIVRRGTKALLALRTKYGLQAVEAGAMDRITALRVAATLEFLSNNLPPEVVVP